MMIQVNTSPWEGTKSGVLAADVPALADVRDGEEPVLSKRQQKKALKLEARAEKRKAERDAKKEKKRVAREAKQTAWEALSEDAKPELPRSLPKFIPIQ